MLRAEGSEWGRKSSRYCCASRSLEIGDDKEKAEEQIRTAKDQVRPVHSSLQDEGNHRCAVTDFFEDGRNHERSIAHGVRGDENKSDLPGQRDSHESIEESRMRDRRRVAAPD